MKRPSIYVETRIRSSMEQLWAHTQRPELHQQWDLRFTEIEYLPRASEAVPQQFLYATRIGFGLGVAGCGESLGTREKNGERTSVLKFWSDEKVSLIREGAGFWKYVPTDDGLRFFTRYDYQTRFGVAGEWLDRLAFRPLIGWATAWSFDSLRLWLEQGQRPAVSRALGLIMALVRFTLGFVWIYQGVVPKLLFPDTGELRILQGAGFSAGTAHGVAAAVGVGEILFGLLFWLLPMDKLRPVYWLNMLGLLVLGAGALFSQPAVFVAPFNPLTLNLALMALAAVALAIPVELVPSATRCLRRPPEGARTADKMLQEAPAAVA
ncbi:DoxX-like family protein [Hymenobacter properus]|uniref:DoxX-like family protein n=1 Tax=Hymenobacter properus TaxID=2791026 RepID=A0A931BQ34_9BACT|nr:DoxX-like family protein [Hymenobacter properus]MBF9143545.1 DoxX-like family protein [Hymenobacter properus]MBR7722358.1 DoxX-like family protein [Microvirga sp. SRT04]